MVGIYRQASREAEAKYAEFIMKRKNDEWSGTVEEKLEEKTRTRTLGITYVQGGGADLTETIRVSRSANGEEVGIVVKKVHLNQEGKTGWGDIEFSFGGWKYPTHFEVQKENERIDNSSPNTVKTDFGIKKIDKKTGLFNGKGTLFGCQQDSIYATLSDKGNLISYIETTEGAIGVTKITVHIERLYRKESQAFESFSADISVGDGIAERALDASLHLESERTKFLNFLSQQPVENWSKEMELKTGNLK